MIHGLPNIFPRTMQPQQNDTDFKDFTQLLNSLYWYSVHPLNIYFRTTNKTTVQHNMTKAFHITNRWLLAILWAISETMVFIANLKQGKTGHNSFPLNIFHFRQLITIFKNFLFLFCSFTPSFQHHNFLSAAKSGMLLLHQCQYSHLTVSLQMTSQSK